MAYVNAWEGIGRAERQRMPGFVMPLKRGTARTVGHNDRRGPRGARSRAHELSESFTPQMIAAFDGSPLLRLGEEVALLRPVLHELAHVEQTSCAQSDPDFAGMVEQFFLAGKRDFDFMGEQYQLAFCDNLPRNEAHADIRAADLLLSFLSEEGPLTASAAHPFSNDVTPEFAAELTVIDRFPREFALMSVIGSMEYEALVLCASETSSSSATRRATCWRCRSLDGFLSR